MSRRRVLDWVLIVVLSGASAVLFARAVGDGLRSGRGRVLAHVTSAPAGDYPLVLSSRDAGLRPGDRIEAVDGKDLAGASALDFYDRATQAARDRGFSELRVTRGGASVDTRVGLTPSSRWWLPLATSAVVLLSGILLLVRAPAFHLGRRNLLMCWCFATIDFAAGRFPIPPATPFETNLAFAMFVFGTGLLAWNLQEFTLSARPVPRWHRALAVVAGGAGAYFYVFRLHLSYTPAEFLATRAGLNTVGVAAILAGLTRAHLRSDRLERRRVRWVIFGFCVAIAGTVLSNFTQSPAPELARLGGSLSTLGIPIGVLVSIIGYRWLDIDRLISAAASYAILGIAVLGALLALVPWVATTAAPAIGLEPGVAQWLLTMALVGAAIPAQLYLRPRLDRRMFADRHRVVSGMERLVEELGDCADADELWRLASERIDELLEPDSLVVYARDGSSFSPRFVRGRESSPPYDADSLLVRALERRGQPLAADSSALDPFDRAALETLGVALVVPIRAERRVLAFACLGRKRSGDIYTREETSQLEAVAVRCAELLRPSVEPQAGPVQVFRREGDLWTIESRGKQIHLRDMRGLHYLATLLREPGREFAALDLVRAASGVAATNGATPGPELRVVRQLGDAGPVLDVQARTEYRARMIALEAELADAERCADLGRLERTSEEREALLAELEAAARGGSAGSDSERARVAVTKAIKAALERIADSHPELGAHLAATIRRGYVCAYEPDPRAATVWDV